MNKLQQVTTFEGLSFDEKRMDYYVRYFTEYYHDAFRPHQGTEVILDVLKRYAPGGIWLDVGAGPATLFWGLMLKGIKELHCTELYIEGLKVLDDFMRSETVPQCYRDVVTMYNVAPGHLALLRSLPRDYFLYDALRPWPAELSQQQYDLITAYGVFGLTTNPEDYKRCFSYLKPSLKPGGVVLGANWIRSQRFINEGNTDNRFMKPGLVKRAAETYGYELLHASQETIQDDPNYDGVIVWALRQ